MARRDRHGAVLCLPGLWLTLPGYVRRAAENAYTQTVNAVTDMNQRAGQRGGIDRQQEGRGTARRLG